MNTSSITDELFALGSRLRASGNLAEAADVFSQIARMCPGDALAQANAGAVCTERAFALAARGDMASARDAFAEAARFAPGLFSAHWGLYETNLVLGNESAALAHQRAALAITPLITRHARTETPAFRVLALFAPGTFQANIPLDFVIDAERAALYKLHLLGDAPPPFPAYDIVFTAIADAPDAAPYLAAAERFIETAKMPFVNVPNRVPRTSRDAIAERFATSTTVVVAPLVRTTRDNVHAMHPAYPFLIRPLASHAGDDLAKIDDAPALERYLTEVPNVPEFYCSAFVDYRSADGFYRKYRIAFVDGVPYPVHLAISPRWMIHYYNAEMAENAWMRDEEHAFMRDIDSVFDGVRAAALREIAGAMELDYFGIDCAIGPDGRLVLFEASIAMLVHMNDPVERYPYKAKYVPRIIAALERLFADRIAEAATRR